LCYNLDKGDEVKLKKRLDFRKVLIAFYFVAFIVYLIVGLQPADAKQYDIIAHLSIPSIGLTSDVTAVQVQNGELETPDKIVGSFSNHENKTFLFGHSSTVFGELNQIETGEEIVYNGKLYIVTSREILLKSDISMNKLLAGEDKDTIVVMTCAGAALPNNDATHRLIITAVIE